MHQLFCKPTAHGHDLRTSCTASDVCSNHLRMKDRPDIVRRCLFSFSGLARLRIFSKSTARARMRVCRYAFEHFR
eukprot:m.78346 g.78346  ORF g.78346 m.78346 type:complete len:75 (-) comp16226_c0_seq1:836-1060(-)